MPSDQQDNQEPLGALLGFLERDPTNKTLRLEAGELALAAGRPDICVKLVSESGNQDEAAFLELKARASMAAGDFEAAIRIFLSLISEFPKNFVLAANLSAAYFGAGKYEDALKQLDLKRPQETAHLAMIAIRASHILGDFEQAKQQCDLNTQAFQNDTQVSSAASLVYLDAGEIENASKYAQLSSETSDAKSVIGYISLQDKDLDIAKTSFEQAIALQSKNPRGLIGLGLIYLLARDYYQSTSLFERALEIWPDNSGLALTTGWAHLLNDNLKMAKSFFERAAEADRNFGEAQGAYALSLLLEGEATAAEEHHKRAIRLDRQNFASMLKVILDRIPLLIIPFVVCS